MKLLRLCTIFVLNLCVYALLVSAQPPDAAKATPPDETTNLTRSAVPSRSTALDLTRVGVQQNAPLPLSLQDVIRRALENNNDIEISRDDVRFQRTQVDALLGFYDGTFTITPNFTRNSTTGSSATKDFRVNSNFTHNLREGGGNYTVFFNNSRTENAFAQAQTTSGSITGGSSALYSSSTGFSYVQPLFRNRSIDNTRRNIAIQRKRVEQTESDFRLNASSTMANVARAYWDYVFSLRNQQNELANVNLSRENLRQVEARIQAGTAAPLERAEVTTELANREGNLLVATQQVSIAENALKQLILRDPNAAEWSMTITPTDVPAVSPDPANLDAAMRDAMDNRFELRRLRLQKDMNQIDIRYFKNQLKPQIDLNTTFSLGGIARSGTSTATTTNLLTGSADLFLLSNLNATRTSLLLPAITNPSLVIPASPGFLFGNFGQSLGNLFRTDAPNFTIGATISFPLHNRTAKANLAAARITEHQLDSQLRAQEQTVIVDVRNAVQAVETARQRVDIARRARENAEIQLEGERKLYEAGSARTSTFLLFQRENTLTNARNAEIRAQTDYNKAVSDLQRVTATIFRANNITVRSPLEP